PRTFSTQLHSITIAPQTKPLSPPIRRDRMRSKCGSCRSEPAHLRICLNPLRLFIANVRQQFVIVLILGYSANRRGARLSLESAQLSPQPSPNQIDCLSRAAQCRERAERNDASCVKAAYLRQAEVWLYLAGSDQFEEKDMPKAVK